MWKVNTVSYSESVNGILNSNSGVGSDSKGQLVRAEPLMTFARSKEGHPRNNQGNLKRALFSAKKKRRLTRVNADHVPAYAKPFLPPRPSRGKAHPSFFPIPTILIRTIDQFEQLARIKLRLMRFSRVLIVIMNTNLCKLQHYLIVIIDIIKCINVIKCNN